MAMRETTKRETIVVLPHATDITRVAEASRLAMLTFVNGARRWRTVDLTRWLHGSYALATSFVRDATRGAIDSGAGSIVDPRFDESLVRGVLDECHEVTLETLRAAVNPVYAETVVQVALGSDLIAECQDEEGALGWAPVARPRVVLADRLVSLLAADLLTRPHDYESAFAVCRRCGGAVFDLLARSSGLCRAHRSGVITRNMNAVTVPAPRGERP